jgi:cell division protein FtsI/penicillin-binding protein 2
MVTDRDTISIELGRIIQMDPLVIDRSIIAHPESRYVVIDQELEEWQVERLKQANLKGVGLEPRLVRHYPQGDLAAGVVGRVGFEGTGQSGFEMIFNRGMTPTYGKLTFLRDVGRRALWIDPADYLPGHDGKDVRLSMDLVIQEFAERHLNAAVKEYNAGGGRLRAAGGAAGGSACRGSEERQGQPGGRGAGLWEGEGCGCVKTVAVELAVANIHFFI